MKNNEWKAMVRKQSPDIKEMKENKLKKGVQNMK